MRPISKIEGANEAKKSRVRNLPTCANYVSFFWCHSRVK